MKFSAVRAVGLAMFLVHCATYQGVELDLQELPAAVGGGRAGNTSSRSGSGSGDEDGGGIAIGVGGRDWEPVAGSGSVVDAGAGASPSYGGQLGGAGGRGTMGSTGGKGNSAGQAGSFGGAGLGGRAGSGGASAGGRPGAGGGGTGGAVGGSPPNSAAGSGGSPAPTEKLLSGGKSASADSEEKAKGNVASLGNDGSLTTRWCAMDGAANHYWQVDLGAVSTLTRLQVNWEKAAIYKFKVEGSSDSSSWSVILDQTNSSNANAEQSYSLSVKPRARWVRITVTGLASSVTWASFFEFQVRGY